MHLGLGHILMVIVCNVLELVVDFFFFLVISVKIGNYSSTENSSSLVFMIVREEPFQINVSSL